MATSSNEDNPTRTSTTVLGQHPSNVSCRPHFPACQVHVDLLFKLYRRVGSKAIIRTYRNPTDCIITLDPSRISFESFKELVILRIGHAHHDLDTVIRADLELGTPTMRWSVGISNNEAALFRKPAFMPTSHDQIFQQWIWSINITQQGRPHVSIMQDMLDAAYEEHGATQSRSVSPSGNNNPPDDVDSQCGRVREGDVLARLAAGRPDIALTTPLAHRDIHTESHSRPKIPEPLTDFFDYCNLCKEVVQHCLINVLVEQHIDRYELFASPIIINVLQSPQYCIPLGLIVILSSNVENYKAYLQSTR
ncbi:hypothetical protein PSTG_09788 [Puccinia striiformis f. sp. tritici PST-78]|uniref:Uncharacterized protein n=1 Tax=Puccinia striiformis f. sp. tritici PST-78 TaxID=1165861 RepID=A0A0L0VCG8_9BASI|nr:hypothetical protein PSTG_09788 [Puccinia striiformis f. sp. tritici PST-78]